MELFVIIIFVAFSGEARLGSLFVLFIEAGLGLLFVVVCVTSQCWEFSVSLDFWRCSQY